LFTTLCNKLPLDFKSQYILEGDNALTLLIVKVAENIEDYKRFFEEIKDYEVVSFFIFVTPLLC
jgi:hypothetical protein